MSIVHNRHVKLTASGLPEMSRQLTLIPVFVEDLRTTPRSQSPPIDSVSNKRDERTASKNRLLGEATP
uniref:Transcriptional regulator n=1 Tax=Steinernema glaseri TaxID=37863 RepID=A0A1I7ZAK4_9BILA